MTDGWTTYSGIEISIIKECASQSLAIRNRTIVVGIAYNKSVDHRSGIDVLIGEDMIGIICLSCRTDLAAQGAAKSVAKVTLGKCGFSAFKAAVNSHSVAHFERHIAIGSGRGVIRSFGDPDLITVDAQIDSGLNIGAWQGIRPAASVLRSCTSWSDVADRGLRNSAYRKRGKK